jgi:hypothetical protein
MLYTHEMLSALYAKNHQPQQAAQEYEAAMKLYNGVYSSFAREISPPTDPSAPPRPGL